MATVTSKRADRLSVNDRVAEIATEFGAAYRAWRVYRRTIRELSALDQRELADLGLSASGIKRAALDAAYGKAN